MIRAIRFALAIAVLIHVVPAELRRHAAERELYRATGLAAAAGSGRIPPQSRAQALAAAEQGAMSAAAGLPADSRPIIAAGSARLLSGDPNGALQHYKAALQLGERAEIDLNLGRALLRQGDSRARQLFVRAVWISPQVIGSLPRSVQEGVRTEIATLESRLGAGSSGSPPPLPYLPR